MTADPYQAPAQRHEPVHWWDFALCREVDTDMFILEKGQDPRPAKQVCSRCPVAIECLQDALDVEDLHAIRGGTTPRERQRMLPSHRPSGLTRKAQEVAQRRRLVAEKAAEGLNSSEIAVLLNLPVNMVTRDRQALRRAS